MVAGVDSYGNLIDARSMTPPMVAGMRNRAMGIAAHA
jgi:hypothetical protein